MADLREILRRHQVWCPHCRVRDEKRARWQREQEDGQLAFEQMMREIKTAKAGARELSDTVHTKQRSRAAHSLLSSDLQHC